MPTISVDVSDMLHLLGRKISLTRLEDTLPLIKCEVKDLTDDILTLEVNADRSDMFSAEGIARVLKGFLGIEKGYSSLKAQLTPLHVNVASDVQPVRPYIVSAVISGVKLTEKITAQIMQLQEKLHEGLCRKRRKASIGIYDLEKIKPPLTYTALAPENIRFTPLGEASAMTAVEILASTPKGIQYGDIIRRSQRYPLLVDSKGQVLSMPPIINSEETRVTLNTKNIFIDVTGMNEDVINQALNILVYAFADRGGKPKAVRIKYPARSVVTPKLTASRYKLSVDYVNAVIGLNLTSHQIAALGAKMRYYAKTAGENAVKIAIPPYRVDILHSIDLVEDIAISYGYNRLKPVLPQVSTVGRSLGKRKLINRIRSLMVGFGFQETASYMLSSREVQFKKMSLEETAGEVVDIGNPVSMEYTIIRPWLLPGVLDFLSHNTHVEYPHRVFECGDILHPNSGLETQAKNEIFLAAAVSDYKASYEDIQSILYSFLTELKITDWTVKRLEHASFTPGRAAAVYRHDLRFGILGEIHPHVLNNFGLPNPTPAFEINLSNLNLGLSTETMPS